MRRIGVINGLRGIAILIVIFHHLFAPYHLPLLPEPKLLGLLPLRPFAFMSAGFPAVMLFFVLSGFVLALPYTRGERDFVSGKDVFRFYRHRALRLLPLYWCVVIAVLLYVAPPHPYYDAFFLMTGLGVFHPGLWEPSYYVIFWSIQVELWLSILFPALWYLLQRVGIHRFAWCTVFGSLLVRCAPYIFQLPDVIRHMQHSVLGIVDAFALGMAVAAWFARGAQVRSLAIPIVSLTYIWVGLSLHETVKVEEMPYLLAFVPTLYVAGGALLLAWIVTSSSQILCLCLGNRPLQLVGMMCYSLYLLHILIGSQVYPMKDARHALLYVVILFTVSLMTYRFIEFPTKNWRQLVPEKAMH